MLSSGITRHGDVFRGTSPISKSRGQMTSRPIGSHNGPLPNHHCGAHVLLVPRIVPNLMMGRRIGPTFFPTLVFLFDDSQAGKIKWCEGENDIVL